MQGRRGTGAAKARKGDPLPLTACSRRRRINYEDPNYNIGLPVLTIHGNHDDPAGTENLSAVDILSTCRLVNYFGKVGTASWQGCACTPAGRAAPVAQCIVPAGLVGGAGARTGTGERCPAKLEPSSLKGTAGPRIRSLPPRRRSCAALPADLWLVDPGPATREQAAIEGTGTGKLRIAPVLLQKGGTRVALYGLGNLRDERLCRLFQTPGHVEW